jgi:hypothetical protein
MQGRSGDSAGDQILLNDIQRSRFISNRGRINLARPVTTKNVLDVPGGLTNHPFKAADDRATMTEGMRTGIAIVAGYWSQKNVYRIRLEPRSEPASAGRARTGPRPRCLALLLRMTGDATYQKLIFGCFGTPGGVRGRRWLVSSPVRASAPWRWRPTGRGSARTSTWWAAERCAHRFGRGSTATPASGRARHGQAW